MRRSGSSYLSVAFVLASAALSLSSLPAESDAQVPYAVTVEVDLVVVPVAVSDPRGALVSRLRQSDFHVFEDGVPQEVLQFDSQDTPVAMGLLMDTSGSMRSRLHEVIDAAVELARNSNPLDQVFVIHFNEDIDFGLPVGEPFTSNLADLEAAVGRTSPAGKTALYDAVVAGLKHLEKSSLKRKALVVVSDGGDNASRHTLLQAENLAAASQSVIYSIFITDQTSKETRPRILKKLAKVTGGIFFKPEEIMLLPQIGKRIATDLRTQYTLGYISSNRKRDGTFRYIRVVVDTPDHRRLFVRTRAGYIAPNDEERKTGEAERSTSTADKGQ